jgi:hypothetical protein
MIHIGRKWIRDQLYSMGGGQPESLRWVLAHEMWHINQFKSGGNLTEMPNEDRRLLECQADTMAGYYVFETISGNYNKKVDAVQAILSLPQTIALVEQGPSTHPNELQRRVAIRSGMTRSMYQHLPEMVSSDHLESTKQKTTQLLDFTDGEPLADWTLRLCKRIIQYDSSLRYLQLDDHQITFNRDAESPFVYFTLKYRNNDSKRLRITMQILSMTTSRKYPHDQTLWQIYDAMNQEFELAPQETYEVHGTLSWGADEDFMPMLLYPPNKGSMVSAQEVASDEIPNAEISTPLVEGLTAEAAALAASLMRLASEAKNDFRNIRGFGCGGLGGEFRSCPSTIEIPNSTRTNVWIERNGSARINARLYSGLQMPEAQAVYDKFSSLLHSIWPFKKITTSTSSIDGLPTLQLQYANSAELNLDLSKDGEIIEVYLRISPVRSD